MSIRHPILLRLERYKVKRSWNTVVPFFCLCLFLICHFISQPHKGNTIPQSTRPVRFARLSFIPAPLSPLHALVQFRFCRLTFNRWPLKISFFPRPAWCIFVFLTCIFNPPSSILCSYSFISNLLNCCRKITNVLLTLFNIFIIILLLQ